MTDRGESAQRGVLMFGVLKISASDRDFVLEATASILMHYSEDNPLTVDIVAHGDVLPVVEFLSVDRELLIASVEELITVGEGTPTMFSVSGDDFRIERHSIDGRHLSIDVPLRAVAHMVRMMKQMVPNSSEAMSKEIDSWLE